MATYSFDTITAAEALALTDADVVRFAGGSSMAINVLYLDDRLAVTFGSRTLEFSPGFGAASRAGNVQFADGSKLYVGDAGADNAGRNWTGSYDVALFGGDGADTLAGSFGGTFIHGNAGDDDITGFSGRSNVLYGGKGNDRIAVATGGPADGSFLHGNMGADSIFGGSANDTLLGGQDNDRIVGNGGMDYINGNLGDDDISMSFLGGTAYGEAGMDTIFGAEGGESRLFGGDGDDVIHSRGPGVADGGAGDDNLYVRGSAHQTLLGGSGSDHLLSSDSIVAREGHHLRGGDGHDWLMSIHGGDTMWGDAGFDALVGSTAKAVMFGGADHDLFTQVVKDISSAAKLDEIHDWTTEDAVAFTKDRYAPPEQFRYANYAETNATDYSGAVTVANSLMQNGADVVAVQVGADTFVFADVSGDGQADAGVILVGVGLGSISDEDIY